MDLGLVTENRSAMASAWSEEAEQNVLAVAFMNPKAAAVLTTELRPDDFYLRSHRGIFAAMQEQLAKGRDVDPVILGEHLRDEAWFQQVGGMGYLHSLVALPALASLAREYAQIVRDYATRRELAQIGNALIEGRLDAAEAAEVLRRTSSESPGLEVVGGEFIVWKTLWDRDRNQPDWVYEDVLARGRGHALYATHKEGKSLFMLSVAAKLATGSEPIVVIYLDYEMGESDLRDRLADMGYGPATDFARLRYALLPSLPPLDTNHGAVALMRLIDQVQGEWPDHHVVVVIDTISRAISGEENSSDTFRDFYSHTGIELKRRGVTWIRLDHGGKDPTKGPRGSSGKGDDVDVVWRLTRTENGVCLHRDVARMPWVPEKVSFSITEDPLIYTRVAYICPPGTSETAEVLDRLGVPLDASASVAQAALQKADAGRRKQVVAAALKWRRERCGGG